MMMNSYDEVFVANHEWKQLQEPFLSNFLNQRKVYEKDFIEIIKMGIQKGNTKFRSSRYSFHHFIGRERS